MAAAGGGPGLVLVVDGSNVACSVEPRLEDRQVLDRAATVAARLDARLVAVFDGDGPLAAPGRRIDAGSVAVVATGSRPADPRIERIVREELTAGAEVVVVTADRAVVDATTGPQVRTWAPARLLAEASEPAASAHDPQAEVEGPATSRLATVLPAEVLERLEALRRST